MWFFDTLGTPGGASILERIFFESKQPLWFASVTILRLQGLSIRPNSLKRPCISVLDTSRCLVKTQQPLMEADEKPLCKLLWWIIVPYLPFRWPPIPKGQKHWLPEASIFASVTILKLHGLLILPNSLKRPCISVLDKSLPRQNSAASYGGWGKGWWTASV